MKRSLLLALLLACVAALPAEQLTFSIRYIGIKVADVVITDDKNHSGGVLTVDAQSTPFASHLILMNNVFKSEYAGDYTPNSFHKLVDQGDYFEDRITRYRRDVRQATRVSAIDDSRNRSYAIEPDVRDFFTALYHIRYNLADEGDIQLDAAGVPWTAHYRVVEVEQVRSGVGKFEAKKVLFTFTKNGDEKKERSDMLTNNLVTRGDPLYFWFSNDDRRLPLRASFRMKPFPVKWVLEEVRQ